MPAAQGVPCAVVEVHDSPARQLVHTLATAEDQVPAGHVLHGVVEPSGLNLPAGQSPGEAAEPSGDTQDLPAGHGEHAEARGAEKDPTGQVWHAERLPLGLKVPAAHEVPPAAMLAASKQALPAGHAEHDVAPGDDVNPGGHCWQGRIEPSGLKNPAEHWSGAVDFCTVVMHWKPPGQLMQALAPLVAMKKPLAQGVQAVAPAREYVPAVHATAAEPGVAHADPSGQMMHEVAPAFEVYPEGHSERNPPTHMEPIGQVPHVLWPLGEN